MVTTADRVDVVLGLLASTAAGGGPDYAGILLTQVRFEINRRKLILLVSWCLWSALLWMAQRKQLHECNSKRQAPAAAALHRNPAMLIQHRPAAPHCLQAGRESGRGYGRGSVRRVYEGINGGGLMRGAAPPVLSVQQPLYEVMQTIQQIEVRSQCRGCSV